MTLLMHFPEDVDPDEMYYNIGQIKIKYEQILILKLFYSLNILQSTK